MSYICLKSIFVQRKFVVNLALLLLLNFLIKPFWIFGIDRTVQNELVSSADYGTYFALFNFAMLFNILLDLGISSFNNKTIAQNSQLLSKYFSGIVVFKLLLAILYFVITLVVGAIIGYGELRFQLLLFLSINQFLISFIQYLRSNVAGLQLFALDSLFSVLDKTLMLVFCSILIWGNFLSTEFTIMHFVYGQTLAYVIASVLIFSFVLTKVNGFKLTFNKLFLLSILKRTAPFALLVLTMTFYYRVDAIMLDSMLIDGEYQASVYAQAYRLMDAANQIGVLFAGLLLPLFAFMIKKKQPLNKLVRLSFSLIFVPAIVLAIICWSSSTQIMSLLYINVNASDQVLPILMFCFVAIASTYIFGTLLTANNNLKQLNVLALAGLIINVVLNLIFIPSFKAYGSAVASLITQVFVVIIQLILVKKIFSFPVNIKFVLALIAVVGMLLLANPFVKDLGLIYQAVALALLGFVLSFSFKIISIKSIKSLLIKRNERSFE